MSLKPEGPGRSAKRRCPTCGAPTEPTVRPFCSRRCRDRDLGRWLDGSYGIPVVEEPGGDYADVSSDEGR